MLFAQLPLWLNIVLFALSAVIVWAAGTRLGHYVDELAGQTGLGHAFAGMLLLGGITSLPEIAVVSSASAMGNASLSLNNLFGSCVVNLLLIAIADAAIGRKALTSFVSRPGTMLQGVLGIIGLGLAASAAVASDIAIFSVGVWPLLILAFVVFAFWISYLYRDRAPWVVKHDRGAQSNAGRKNDRRSGKSSTGRLAGLIALAGGIILAAGYALSTNGDAIAHKTGLGSGIVGFTLVGIATSLPEISTIVTAVRLGRYEMAIGDIFGTNLFNLGLLFVADAAYLGGPIMNEAGPFEAVAALLGIILTAIFLAGLLERGNRTMFRMGYDSAAAIAMYAAGTVFLVAVIGQS